MCVWKNLIISESDTPKESKRENVVVVDLIKSLREISGVSSWAP
jgi:hypothetical protein